MKTFLYKNSGVTRQNRVVFYDYDELCYLTECNFREIPEAPYPEMEMSEEVWYTAAPGDVFPEEFETFLLTDPRIHGSTDPQDLPKVPRRPAGSQMVARAAAKHRGRAIGRRLSVFGAAAVPAPGPGILGAVQKRVAQPQRRITLR